MAATLTANIWLRLLEHTGKDNPLTPGQVRALCARHKVSDRVLPQMSYVGFAVHADGKYYVDGSCGIPARLTLDEIVAALSKRNARP